MRKKIGFIQALMLLAAVVTAMGCSSTQAPGARVQNISLGEVSDEAYVLNFDLILSNSNKQPLELQDLYYTLTVDGEQVYEGRRSAQSTVIADGAISITVPAVVPFNRVGHDQVPAEIAYALNGSLSYMTPDTIAEMLFDANLWRPSVSFGAEGRLTIEAEAGSHVGSAGVSPAVSGGIGMPSEAGSRQPAANSR